MFLRTAEDFGIRLGDTFYVGDKVADIEAAKIAGCKAILLAKESPPSSVVPDILAEDLLQAVEKIFKVNSDRKRAFTNCHAELVSPACASTADRASHKTLKQVQGDKKKSIIKHSHRRGE